MGVEGYACIADVFDKFKTSFADWTFAVINGEILSHKDSIDFSPIDSPSQNTKFELRQTLRWCTPDISIHYRHFPSGMVLNLKLIQKIWPPPEEVRADNAGQRKWVIVRQTFKMQLKRFHHFSSWVRLRKGLLGMVVVSRMKRISQPEHDISKMLLSPWVRFSIVLLINRSSWP